MTMNQILIASILNKEDVLFQIALLEQAQRTGGKDISN